MTEWKTAALSDLGEIVGGATPSTSREDYYNGQIPWLTPKDLAGYPSRYIRRGQRSITQAGLDSCSARIMPKGTVLFSSRAPIGYVAIAENDLCTNQGFKSIVPNPGVSSLFLYYLLRCHRDRIEAMGSGTTFKEVSGATMRGIQVRVPADPGVQARIAGILDALDTKIELNHRVSANLRQQAQALFRQWVIDSPDARGWRRGTFSQLIENAFGGDWGRESPEGGCVQPVYCLRGADIPEVCAGGRGKMPTRYIRPKSLKTRRLLDGDLVVEVSGGSPTQSTGRAAVISQALLDRYDKGLVCTNFCRALRPAEGYGMFLYHYWQHLYDLGMFFPYENGTTGIKNLDLAGLLQAEPIVIPPPQLVRRFDGVCQAVAAKVYANGLESERLAALRDLLLPRLMSGELDVSGLRI